MKRAGTFQRLLRDRQGATAIEYGLICGLIVMVMIIGFSNFSAATQTTWTTVSTSISNATSQAGA
ncbi:MAG: Flp family type IVb pilin [Sphingomonadales bacterium]|nr:Flp family type IVb pilin [Sphingomonadales bacterium]